LSGLRRIVRFRLPAFARHWFVVVAGVALVLSATSPLVAQPPTATINLTGVNPSGASLAGVYTSPYEGTVNGGSTIPIICDDFADDSFVPEQWSAYVTSLSSLTSSPADSYLKWGTNNDVTGTDTISGTWNLTQLQAYDAAAILSVDILQSTPGSLTQEYLSYALWSLFDSKDALAQLSAYSVDPTTVENDLNAALIAATTGSISGESLSSYLSNYNVNIYSYVPGTPTSCDGGYCPPPPQEFISVSVAEPPSPALLVADLLALAGLFFIARRRLTRSVNLR